MASINVAPIQQIQTIDLPDQFYETQAKIVGALAIGKSILAGVDAIINGSFNIMDNAIVQQLITAGQNMLTSIQTQVSTLLTSANSMIASIGATFSGTATGAIGIIAQVNSISSLLNLINSYITIINNIITQFNNIVSEITSLVTRFSNLQDEIGLAFQSAVSKGIDDYMNTINDEYEPLSNSILNDISTQLDGLQTTAKDIENITTDSWRQYIPPYTVESYTPGEAPEQYHSPLPTTTPGIIAGTL